MARSRMMNDQAPTPVESPSPRTTIVGGRPPESNAALPPVPTGLQKLLRLGSVDEQFRSQLAERPAELARASGIELTASERAMLAAIDPRALAAMAERVPSPPAPRRELLRRTAATAVVLLGGAALVGSTSACRTPATGSGVTDEPAPPRPDEPAPPTGIAPDMPPVRPDHREMETEGGAAPDEPPPPRPEESPPPAGIAPDMPPVPPGHRGMDAEGGAAHDEQAPRVDHREMDTTGGAEPDMPPERPQSREAGTKGGARPDLP